MEVVEIKEILRRAGVEVDIQGHGKHIALFESDFERVAIEVVKSCSIPFVVDQSEQLKCDCGETENVKKIAICACCYNPHTGEW